MLSPSSPLAGNAPKSPIPRPKNLENSPSVNKIRDTPKWSRGNQDAVDGYELFQQIGKGAFGIIFAAKENETGNDVAIKKVVNVFGDSKELKRTLREVKLMRYFSNHKNIIGVKHLHLCTERDQKSSLYIVMELMEMDMHQLLLAGEPLPPQRVKDLMFQLLCGIRDIHNANVVHRDIRPRNLLIKGNLLKITDFGMGRARGIRMSILDLTTTRWYRAPEGFFNRINYTNAVDIWSSGCIFVELLGHKNFLKGTTDLEQLELILTLFGPPPEDMLKDAVINRFQKEILQKVSGKSHSSVGTWIPELDPMALDLVEKMLMVDPKSRITASQALEHPYFKGCIVEQENDGGQLPKNINCEDMDEEQLQEELRKEVSFYCNLDNPLYSK